MSDKPRYAPEQMREMAARADAAEGPINDPNGGAFTATAAMLRQGADAIERWEKLKVEVAEIHRLI